MGTLLEDIDTASEWIARALASSGYVADFSPASLWQLDFFLEDHTEGGRPRPGGLLSENLGKRVFALGAYLGEVLLRARGGEWIAPEGGGPEADLDIAVKFPEGMTVWPVQRVMKRFSNGAEDGIAFYGLALGLAVGPKPDRQPTPRRPWWKFW